jgi:hypothetical protein
MQPFASAATHALAALAIALGATGPVDAEPVFRQVFHWDTAGAPRITTDAEARRVMMQHGLAQVAQLGRVGDYFEANARLGGQPVVAYLFDDGTLRIDRHPKVMVQTGTRLAPPRG